MVALIFFQTSAAIVILGAELNRGISEFKRMGATPNDAAEIALSTSPRP